MQIITNNAGKELKKHGDSAFPFLVSYERLSGYETGSFLWHWHPEIELTYIHKGEMLYKVNQNTFHLKEGRCFSAMPTPFTPVTCTIIRTVSISLSPLIPN